MKNKQKKLSVLNLNYKRQQKKILEALSFQVCSGETLIIKGPNGSGKSTLLRLLTGLSIPENGDIYWQGQSILNLGAAYRHELHYLGHTNGLKLGLTPFENLQLTSTLSLSPNNKEKINYFLTKLQLTEVKNVIVRHLSMGERRRVALLKLFLFIKPIWILDEPFTALDTFTQHILLTEINEHLEKAGICIMSSHHTLSIPNASYLSLVKC